MNELKEELKRPNPFWVKNAVELSEKDRKAWLKELEEERLLKELG